MEKELSDARFKEYVEKKVRKTIRKYRLFEKGEKIVVACSGGKDSTACLYILKQLGYDVEAVTVDANIGEYTENNLKSIRAVCKKNNIKLHVISFKKEFGMPFSKIMAKLKSKGKDYASCMVCGILKRYLLNRFAGKLRFDCIVTGHNLDDEAQAFLMNLFRNDFRLAKRQGPITGSAFSKKFVKRAKPLYELREDECKRYSKIMKFPVKYGICPLSADAYRREYLNLLDEFEKKHPCVKYNLIRFHESMKASLKKEKGLKVGECEICGEPASNKICNACKILKEL